MCVIAYKPTNIAFPSKEILENCFENNPHGAGFMYAFDGVVHITKGYTTFDSFYKALNNARKKTGANVPYVMHFRIATQGFGTTMTHPFPLSGNMDNLKKLKVKCNIGVAHNGILGLTSNGSKDYSDTMKFITDYLSLIIRGYDWFEDKRTVQLIENLISGSRLAILDKNGICSLLGKGWVQDKDVWYSNNTYSYKEVKYTSIYNDWDYPYQNRGTSCGYPTTSYEEAWSYWKNANGEYDFTRAYCPYTEEDDDSYCNKCAGKKECPYVQAALRAVDNTQQALRA